MQDPKNYDRLKAAAKENAELFVPIILDKMNIKSGNQQKILDFGCGSGLFTTTYLLPVAIETNSTIVGLDISEPMISYANQNYSNSRIKYICGNILDDKFEFEETNFDHIISYLVLQVIKDYRGALQKLYELLKPGGKCGMYVVVKYNQFPLYEHLAKDAKWDQFIQGHEKYTPDWYDVNPDDPGVAAENLIKQAALEIGFSFSEFTLKNMSFEFESLRQHSELLVTLCPFLNKIPEEIRPDLLSSTLSIMCNLYGIPDSEEFHSKPYTDHYQTLVIVLEKST